MLPTPIIGKIDYEKVYEPSEDSFLLLDCFEQEKDFIQAAFKESIPFVTEIGTGSGIVTTFIAKNVLPKAMFLATDINPHACKTVIETMLFNPPYVPASEIPEIPTQDEDPVWLDLALVGGEDGMVVTWKVLDCLEQTLSSNGIAYILFCARNKPESVAEIMRERGWNVEVVIHRKAGWEVLSVLKFSKGK
ncbi:eRF1 methyltransferase catalytic subunit MTQ2 [Candida tropicalis]